MNTGTIKEVAYVKCHQYGKYSTHTTTSTCPTMWIEVSRSNIVVHRLIIGHWCIPLIDARSPTEPTDNENGNQGTRVKTNKCEYMCWGQKLERINWSGDIDVFPKLSTKIEPINDDYKSQGTQMESILLFQNKWSEFDGIESAGRRSLGHPQSTNTTYSATLDNVEEFKQERCAWTSNCTRNGRHAKSR